MIGLLPTEYSAFLGLELRFLNVLWTFPATLLEKIALIGYIWLPTGTHVALRHS